MKSGEHWIRLGGLCSVICQVGEFLVTIWAKGYCVDTAGMDAEMICKYAKYQECLERNLDLNLD